MEIILESLSAIHQKLDNKTLDFLIENNVNEILKTAIEKNKLNDLFSRSEYIQKHAHKALVKIIMEEETSALQRLAYSLRLLSDTVLCSLSDGLRYYSDTQSQQNWLHHVATQYLPFITYFFSRIEQINDVTKKNKSIEDFLLAFSTYDSQNKTVLHYMAESEELNSSVFSMLLEVAKKNKLFQKKIIEICTSGESRNSVIELLANTNDAAVYLTIIFKIPGLLDAFLTNKKYSDLVAYPHLFNLFIDQLNDQQQTTLVGAIINNQNLLSTITLNNPTCFNWLISKTKNTSLSETMNNVLYLAKTHREFSTYFCDPLSNTPNMINRIFSDQNAGKKIQSLFQVAHHLAESTENKNMDMLDSLCTTLLENKDIKNKWVSFIMNEQSSEDKIQAGKLILLELIQELKNMKDELLYIDKSLLKEDESGEFTQKFNAQKQKIINLLKTESAKKSILGSKTTLLDIIIGKKWNDVINQIDFLDDHPDLNKKLLVSRNQSPFTLFNRRSTTASDA